MDEIKSITDLKTLCEVYCSSRRDIQAVTDELKKKQEFVRELEAKIINALESHGMDKFSTPEIGTISRYSKLSVKIPKTQEERELFFSYLKTNGVFDELITVNSQTLNAWYKEHLEMLAKKGDEKLEIPGLTEVTSYDVLSWRKG